MYILFLHICHFSCIFVLVRVNFARPFIIFRKFHGTRMTKNFISCSPPLKSQVLQRKQRSLFNLSEKWKTINHFLNQFILFIIHYFYPNFSMSNIFLSVSSQVVGFMNLDWPIQQYDQNSWDIEFVAPFNHAMSLKLLLTSNLRTQPRYR
jgi:hypothetical protein